MQVSIETIRAGLAQIEQAVGGAASKPPRAQLLKTIAFLDEHAGKTVEEVLAALEAAKPPPKAKAPAKARILTHPGEDHQRLDDRRHDHPVV